jgi:D-alanine transaminase
LSAREAFISGAGGLVQPVVRIDGKEVSNGKPGPVATRLRAAYIELARRIAE